MFLNSRQRNPLNARNRGQTLLCFYSNSTPDIQIVKLRNSKSFELERVLLPEERLMFTAIPEAQLEITTCNHGFPMTPKRIACDRLQVEVSETDYSPSIAC